MKHGITQTDIEICSFEVSLKIVNPNIELLAHIMFELHSARVMLGIHKYQLTFSDPVQASSA